GGRITREDIERAAREPKAQRAQPSSPGPQPRAASDAAGSVMPFRGVRRTIAERMHSSLQQSAQITIASEADVTAATEVYSRLTKEHDCTYTDMMIQAVARALRLHPRLNARLTEGGIAMLKDINIGVAVALEEGLIVPVIRDADRKALN